MRSTHFWRLVPGAALILLSAGSSMAMTLGRAQGVAVLGRPLDVTIPVVLDNPADDICARADVYYGETRVDARAVELRPQAGQNAVMRVQVSRPVDEAFITVQAQVGCTQTLSRRFVLLSDAPVEVAEAAAQPAPVAPAVMPVPSTLAVQSSDPAAASASPGEPAMPGITTAASPAVRPQPIDAPVTPAPRRARPAATAESRASTAAPVPAPRAEPAVKPAPRQLAAAPAAPAAPKPAVVERPRLKLDTTDLGAPVPGALKSTDSLQAAVPASPTTPAAPAAPVPPQRTEAAAQWQALNAQPEDILRSTERMTALEADVRTMRDSMLKNQAMLADLNARLQQAEGERYANGLVYALAALLAGASGLAGWLWLRNRRAAAAYASWWSDSSEAGEPVLHEEGAAAELKALPATGAGTEGVARTEQMGAHDDGMARPATTVATAADPVIALAAALDAVESDTQPTAEEMQSLLASTAAALPVGETNTALDELKDVAQQAEFFVSLGEYERAIAVLRGQIDAHPQASALPWLELLALYQQLQRQDDYEQLRHDFEWLFKHTLPASGVAGAATVNLEQACPEVFAAIQAAWGTPEAIDCIEDRLLRRAGREASHLVDLGALRELLMLHGVALDHLAQGGGSTVPMPTSTSYTEHTQHASLPEAAVGSAAGSSTAFAELSMASHPDDGWAKLSGPSSRPAGLDVNLDDLDHAPTAGAGQSPDAVAKSVAVPDANLLDFDLDTSEQFKLPKRS